MQYTRYEEKIVQRYGVALEGWTYDQFVNPSELSTALGPLKALVVALDNDTCKFVKLTAAQREARKAEWEAKLAAGEINPQTRKRRSDAGVKRKNKRARTSRDGNSSDGEGKEASIKVKSAEFIDDDSDKSDAE